MIDRSQHLYSNDDSEIELRNNSAMTTTPTSTTAMPTTTSTAQQVSTATVANDIQVRDSPGQPHQPANTNRDDNVASGAATADVPPSPSPSLASHASNLLRIRNLFEPTDKDDDPYSYNEKPLTLKRFSRRTLSTSSSESSDSDFVDEDFPEDSMMSSSRRTTSKRASTRSAIPLHSLEDESPSPMETSADDSEAAKKLKQKRKIKRRIIIILRILSLLPILYMFICSLDLLTSGFQLLAGKTAGSLFAQNELLQNPIAGLMIGVIVTVLVQSSSTTTSIIVSMVSAGILPVRYSIPMIMGANVGTSTTNTIVSLGQMGVVEEFKRAFAGATIHDAFNWMNVLVQLPLEVGTGYLYKMTSQLVESINSTTNVDEPQFLQVITKPLTKAIIQINWTVVENIAQNISMPDDVTLRKLWCDEETYYNETLNETITTLIPCNYLFLKLDWPDWAVGLLITIIALVILMVCLILLVRTLRRLLEGKISKILRKTIDKNFPGVFRFLTPYVFILVGIGLTIIVQSSSVFTSALTPLVGTGVISLKRMYPLTLGSNVGTTITAILSAMTSPNVERLRDSLQAALCHLFFNVFGIVIFFVIIPMRRLPTETAKFFGRQTAKYRWFAIFYLILAFLVIPGIMLALSLAGLAYALTLLIVMIVLTLAICIINYLMKYKPKYLPSWLKSWNFLPEPLRSLAPYDRFFIKIKLYSRSIVPAKVIRPDTSVTSMTHLFRHRDNEASSNSLV